MYMLTYFEQKWYIVHEFGSFKVLMSITYMFKDNLKIKVEEIILHFSFNFCSFSLCHS